MVDGDTTCYAGKALAEHREQQKDEQPGQLVSVYLPTAETADTVRSEVQRIRDMQKRTRRP